MDIIWQDGSHADDAPATTFAPAKHVDGYYEFWPQDFVVGKAVAGGSACNSCNWNDLELNS